MIKNERRLFLNVVACPSYVNLSITAVEDFTLPMAYRTQEGSTIESVDVNADGLSVSATLSELSFTDQYEDLDKVINAVLPAFQSGRGFTLNGGERAFLRNYAVGTSYTNMIANNILFFFADERVTQEFLVPSGGASSAPSSETAAIISLQAQHAVSIYPNPAKHTIRIIVTGDNSYTGEILDVQGKVMMHINSGEGNTIDISSLSAGMYFMRVQAGDVNELHKLLVR